MTSAEAQPAPPQDPPGTAAPRPDEPRRWPPLVTIGLVCGPFISMIDSNAVNVAIPEIARQMDATVATVGWAISSYLLGIATCLPASAWLARRFGTRRVYATALVAFGLASLGCAGAPSVEWLIGLRAVQGMTSAPLIPLAVSLMFGGRSGLRPPLAAGLFFFLAPALGPTFGGLISESVGWRPIFFINAPIVVLGLLGVRRIPPGADPTTPTRVKLDLVGIALLACGAAWAIYGASVITANGWEASGGWPSAAAGVAVLGAYTVYGRRRERQGAPAALSLRLMSSGASRVAVLVCALASIVLFGVQFLIPVFVVDVQGHSALVAGLVLFPQGIAMGLFSGLGEKLVRWMGLRGTVLSGMAILTVTTSLLLMISTGTPPWLSALLLTGRGAALGLTLQPLITGLLTRSAADDVTDVSTLLNVTQRMAGSLGVAGVAAFFQAQTAAGAAADAPFAATVVLLVVLGAVGLLLALGLPGVAGSGSPPRLTDEES